MKIRDYEKWMTDDFDPKGSFGKKGTALKKMRRGDLMESESKHDPKKKVKRRD